MALITLLAFACALAEGRRVQPAAQSGRGQYAGSSALSTEDSPISVQSEKKYSVDEKPLESANVQSEHVTEVPQKPSIEKTGAPAAAGAGTQPPNFLQHFAHLTSLVQEYLPVSEKTREEWSADVKKFNIAIHNAKDYIVHPGPFGMFVASGLLAVMVWSCYLSQKLAKYIPRKRTRIQHFHEGRMVYEWDQTPKVGTIYIRPPTGVRKCDLDIRISSRHLRVGRKGKPAFLREETYDLVNEEMSSWSLRSNGELQIYLQKVRRAEWPSILVHNVAAMSSKFRPALPLTRQEKSAQ
mmetsp:Transcript_3500/g.6873  ORF Transcript_3500/g.6873 Transcript_3500/m.6873 type:complete len:296 (+) Transcript_3500:101-988(+)